MRCFYHQDKEAVGTCKSCGKGLCQECAVDLAKGLACRGHCEADAQAVIQIIQRNIELSVNPAKAQLVVSQPVQRTGQPTDYIASQLTSHIRETRYLHWMLGLFCGIVGAVLLVAGFSGQLVLLDVVGACSLAFGLVCFAQVSSSAAQPRLSETKTR